MPRTKATSKPRQRKLNANDHQQMRKLVSMASVMRSRAELAATLGKSFGGDRDLYTQLGYPKTLTFEQMNARFVRQDIAKTVVTAYPEATWKGKPTVYETEDEDETAFEKDWNNLIKAIRVFHYLTRADKVAGIGQYGVIFLGLDDPNNKTPEKMVKKGTAKRLLYMQVLSQSNAAIGSTVKDVKNERFGKPLTYKLQLSQQSDATTTAPIGVRLTKKETTVHWTRVIHIPDGALESDVFGTPRLECVYNALQNLAMVGWSSAEMFYKGAYPGLALEGREGAELEESSDDLDDEVEDYIHGLSRVLRLRNAEAKMLAPVVADPESHVKVQLQFISGATRIPIRILIGSERGELASSQDARNWNERVAERQQDFAEPTILKPFAERLVHAGVLSEPGEDGINVAWPPLVSLGEKEKAEITFILSQAIAKFASAPGADTILPLFFFLTEIMHFDVALVTSIIEHMSAEQEEETDEEEAARKQKEQEEEEAEKEDDDGEEE